MEFWFEFASTYSYPAAMRIERAAQQVGVALAWRPFLLGPIFKEQGLTDSPFRLFPVKGRYMWRDLERTCAALGIPLQKPTQFPRVSVLAARLACRFQEEAWLPEFVRRIYSANFAHDRDIADPGEVAAIVRGMGLPENLLREAESPEAKAKLRAQTERASALGMFGAPSFVCGSELFWGNDRLETALEWARTHAQS